MRQLPIARDENDGQISARRTVNKESHDMDILDRLLGHNISAIDALLERSQALTDAELGRKFDIGLGSVRQTIHHIFENIEWWTDLMNAVPARDLAADALTFDGLSVRFRTVSAQFAEVARRKVREGTLDEHWPARSDQEETHSYGNTIVHVITHAAHHRSQWLYMLKQLGVGQLPMAQALRW
jgi:uncharacterized damage-inducible protein DinB